MIYIIFFIMKNNKLIYVLNLNKLFILKKNLFKIYLLDLS